MGKRSDFQRRPQDAYDTPLQALVPLLDYLPTDFTFAEPCAGAGDLCGLIESNTCGVCTLATDIEPRFREVFKADALKLSKSDLGLTDFIITNPPWTRSILHPMIEHFSDMRPTWLLFDADWKHTKQSAPYLPRLRKIVSVGRVKWIPDSPHTGKDNCSWYLFDKPSDEPAQFYGRVA